MFNVDGFGVARYTFTAADFNSGGYSAEHPALYKNATAP